MWSKLIFKTLVFIFLYTGVSDCFSQDDVPPIDPSAFANFLLNSEHYDFASEEFERLLFSDPSNIVYLKKLIQCYKKTGQSERLINKFQLKKVDDKATLHEYYDLLILANETEVLSNAIMEKEALFSQSEKLDLKYKLAVAKKDWNRFQELDATIRVEKYSTISEKIQNTKYKKPGIAAGLSALIPGAGRFYAKDAKDGIISLIIVGTTAYQSYRRFDQKGIKSVSAWIFGGVSLGFYISNIYGSYQSAKYYNKKLDDKIYQYALPIVLYNTK